MRAPWHVKHITDQITQLFGIKIFVFVHTFREENTLVDHLTNTGEVTKSHAIYYDFGSLPSKVKAMLMIDQQGFPHL
uniref:RNase H family protein n=2 Tax=Solanum tuberosum TaxID=4113 RepID=M1CHQ3_SOLTU